MGPLDLGMVVVLALKAAGIWLPTPYHHFWAYLAPGEEIPQYSAFHMVRAVSAFVMWVANEFLFWPYLVGWIDTHMMGERATIDGPKVHFVCKYAMMVFGFKHPWFLAEMVIGLMNFFGSPWPVLCMSIGLGVFLGLLYRQGGTVAARVFHLLIIPGLACTGSGLGQIWEFCGIWGMMAFFAFGWVLAWLRDKGILPFLPASESSDSYSCPSCYRCPGCCRCPRSGADDRAKGTGVV